jgi:gas vesicle protein
LKWEFGSSRVFPGKARAVSKEKIMRRKSHKNHQNAGVGKVVTGILLGGVVGATVGWLTAPASGAETRRRLRGEVMNARERAKTAVGNIESQARSLAEEISDHADDRKDTVTTRRRRTPSASS